MREYLVVYPDGSTVRTPDPGDTAKRVDLFNQLFDGGPFDMTRLLDDPLIIACVHDEGLLIPLPMQLKAAFSHLAGKIILGTEAFEGEPEDGPDFVGFEQALLARLEHSIKYMPLVPVEFADAKRDEILRTPPTITTLKPEDLQ